MEISHEGFITILNEERKYEKMKKKCEKYEWKTRKYEIKQCKFKILKRRKHKIMDDLHKYWF